MRKVQKTKRHDGQQQRPKPDMVKPEKGLTVKIIALSCVWFAVGGLFENVVAVKREIPVARTAFLELGLLCSGDYNSTAYFNVSVSSDRVYATCKNGSAVIVENFKDR